MIHDGEQNTHCEPSNWTN